MITYKKSGVDIDAGNEFVRRIKPIVKKTMRPEAGGIGGFGAMFKLLKHKYQEPVLVSSTDGVGTKLLIAQMVDKHDTVGIDLVAMSVNDCVCCGAEPLFFLDYIACGKLKVGKLTDVVKGIAKGCEIAGCALIGGETAEMPDMYKKDEYDLAGFCVGVAEKSKIIDGSKIKYGDVLIGIESNGLHSNGYSLVRKVFSKAELKKYSHELLKPTRIYVKSVLSLLEDPQINIRSSIHGISHITGGAFYDKISRIIPRGLCALINKDSWPVPKIFKLIQEKGDVPAEDLYRTLNMGIGLVLVVDEAQARVIQKKIKIRSWIIGKIAKGKPKVILF